MNKELIKELRLHMRVTAQRVGLKINLENQGKFIQMQLLDSNNKLIYTAYEVSQIISFIHGLESDYNYHINK